jgi:predicted ABC-type ATPase
MEAIVLCGVQGSGKTTLYRDRFAATHEHVSLDVLGSRAREAAQVAACLEAGRSFVVDNTNATAADRRRYIDAAREAGFKVVGYLVEGDGRSVHVGPGTAAATARRFVRPAPEEGFDELWHATPAPGGMSPRDIPPTPLPSGRWRIEPLATTPPLF